MTEPTLSNVLSQREPAEHRFFALSAAYLFVAFWSSFGAVRSRPGPALYRVSYRRGQRPDRRP